MKHVLFVDDETKVLEGLGRMLRVMRHEWEMTFVEDPRDAAALLERQAFDAIVCDMRMPQMDGVELLKRAKRDKPGMARIVLSGHAKSEDAMRSVGLAHQFLAKPCDAEALRGTVSRACELRQLLHEVGLAEVVCSLGKLPSLPHLYQAISEEMLREDVSLKRVAGIVGQDIAMTAKVLQLVNSAFFGVGRRVTSIDQAVNYLGIDVIRSLVISEAAFAEFEADDIDFFKRLWRHSTLTGMVAKHIAEDGSKDPLLHGDALQAGMLHDIGALILAARVPDKHRALRAAAGGGESLLTREQSLIGCDHGRVGAYLLGLWGLSDRIVEAIAYHEYPSKCSYREFSPLTAVHAASCLVAEIAGGGDEHEAELDLDYLAAAGCTDRIEDWRAAAARIVVSNGEDDE